MLAPKKWLHLPRRTVRLRLTALYGALFLASGAALLAINYGLVAGRPLDANFAVVRGTDGVLKGVPLPPPNIGQLRRYVACMHERGATGVSVVDTKSGGFGVTVRLQTVQAPRGEKLYRAASSACSKALDAGSAAVTNQVVGTGVVVGPKGQVLLSRDATGKPLAVQAVLPTPGEKQRLLAESGIALGAMALVSIGLGWLVSGRVLRPLRTMTTTARQISEVNLHRRLAVRGPQDELKDLGDTIDGLLGRLERAFEGQRRFVANASHELRTPLTMMRTSLEVAVAKPHAPVELHALATKLAEGLDHADQLMEGLLVLARAQEGALGATGPVSVRALVSAALAESRPGADRLGLSVQDATVEASVLGNETLLARLVGNVVDNAVRHNVPGGTLRIWNSAAGGRARLVVENSGARIDRTWAAHLGEPFYRPGAERLASGDGTGLGLSIVRAITAAHGGSVSLAARPEGGLRVEIDLPVATL